MEPARATTVGIRELRQHASRYVELAAAGQRVPVTRRGRVVAYLVPASETHGDLADLLAAGVLSPAADGTGDVADIGPAAGPAEGPAASDALQQMRDDERW